MVKRALLSVYDKTGIVELANALKERGIAILSTGGTAKLLKSNGIAVTEVATVTRFPEMLDGRVKTLHPAIHAGILADRKNKTHMKELKERGIGPIDWVVVNLYPFEKTMGKKHALAEAIENIDIGGPTLLRAAAKNFENVVVVCNPKRYSDIIRAWEKKEGISESARRALAYEAFAHVAHYDARIANYFQAKNTFPEYFTVSLKKLRDLRYGENHHQRAALYAESHPPPSIASAELLKEGKHLSYNNILDGNAALELLKEFEEPTAVVIKHNNPSGVATAEKILDAYKTARSVDPEAAFGGIVAVNRGIDGELAHEILSTYVEVVIAPGYSKEAKKVLGKRRNLRLLQVAIPRKRAPYWEYRSVVGGLLVQDADVKLFAKEQKVVTQRKPTPTEWTAMKYAWRISKYVKSNSIVFAKENRAVGIGAGQMKRVDAAKLASMIAKDYSGADSLKGCAMASDAFFPFRDGIDFAAKLGISAIIQPGGSIKDAEVIAAADEHQMAMVFTGMRHFRH